MTPMHHSPLPRLFTVAGHTVYDLRPVVLKGDAMPISDLSAAAYGYLEHCGWLDSIHEAPGALTKTGTLSTAWRSAALAAAQRLAEAGASAGPDGDIETWLSWLALEHGAWPS